MVGRMIRMPYRGEQHCFIANKGSVDSESAGSEKRPYSIGFSQNAQDWS